MSHKITFVCDSCETQYMIDETMDLPPHWFAVQHAIADKDGIVPNQEREIFMHFCCQECVVEYSKGNELRERACTVDQHVDDDEEEDVN